MADYPAAVSFFTLTGTLGRGVSDTIDVGGAPDLVPIPAAHITATPMIDPTGKLGPVFKVPATKQVIYQESIFGTTTPAGVVVPALGSTFAPVPNASPGFVIPFGGSAGIVPTGWPWTITVSVGGTGFPDRVFVIYGTAGGSFDLSDLIEVPFNPSTAIADWQAVVNQVLAARDEAVAAANNSGGTGGGSAINDGAIALTSTWSSKNVSDRLSAIADKANTQATAITGLQTGLTDADAQLAGKYTKPLGGIDTTDLSAAVVAKLNAVASGGGVSTPALNAAIITADRGVNFSGLEFDTMMAPTDASIAYAIKQGATLGRLPILLERAQPTPLGALDATYMGLVDSAVLSLTSRDAVCIIDVHNYSRRVINGVQHVLGDGVYTQAMDVDVWSKLAQRYKNNPLVKFGLMNEPHDIPAQVTTGPELLTNPGIETNLIGWNQSSPATASIARTTAAKHSGTYSMSLTNTVAGQSTAESAVLDTVAGNQYAFSTWSQAATTAKQFFALVNWYSVNAQGGLVYISTSTDGGAFVNNSTSAWTQSVSGAGATPIIAPAGATKMKLVIGVSNDTVGNVTYFDDISLKLVTSFVSGPKVWELDADAMVQAIRATGATQDILVAGVGFSAAGAYWTNHPNWFIHDPLNRSFPEAHYYPDGAGTGDRSYSYTNQMAIDAGYAASGTTDALTVKMQTEVTAFLSGARARLLEEPFLGEYAWFQSTRDIVNGTVAPDELTKWAAYGEAFLQVLDVWNAPGTYWSAGDAFAAFGYAYSPYLGTPNNSKTPVAPVIEAHYPRIRAHSLPISRQTAAAIASAVAGLGGGSATPNTYRVRKTTDTSRVSNTTTTLDPDLQFASIPVGEYDFTARLIVYTTAAADLKVGVSGNFSGVNSIYAIGRGDGYTEPALGSGATNEGGVPLTRVLASGANSAPYTGGGVQFGGLSPAGVAAGSYVPQTIEISGVIVVTAAAPVGITWAQWVASADASIMGVGSELILVKVA